MKNALIKALIFMLGPICIIDNYTLPYFPQKCKRAHKNSRNLYMEKRPEGVDARLGADIDDCVRAVTLGICFCAIYFLCEDRFQTNRPLLHTLCIVPDICPSVCIIIIQIQKLIHSFFAVMCDDHHIQNGLCLIKQNGNGICIMNQQILVLQ